MKIGITSKKVNLNFPPYLSDDSQVLHQLQTNDGNALRYYRTTTCLDELVNDFSRVPILKTIKQ